MNDAVLSEMGPVFLKEELKFWAKGADGRRRGDDVCFATFSDSFSVSLFFSFFFFCIFFSLYWGVVLDGRLEK